jgi:hypothetical protein
LLQLRLPGLIDVRDRKACRDQQRIVHEKRLLDTERELQALSPHRSDEATAHLGKYVAIGNLESVESIAAIRRDGGRVGGDKYRRDG